MDYVPYNDNTRRNLAELAALKPRMFAAMHGSTFIGDGAAMSGRPGATCDSRQ